MVDSSVISTLSAELIFTAPPKSLVAQFSVTSLPLPASIVVTPAISRAPVFVTASPAVTLYVPDTVDVPRMMASSSFISTSLPELIFTAAAKLLVA